MRGILTLVSFLVCTAPVLAKDAAPAKTAASAPRCLAMTFPKKATAIKPLKHFFQVTKTVDAKGKAQYFVERTPWPASGNTSIQ